MKNSWQYRFLRWRPPLVRLLALFALVVSIQLWVDDTSGGQGICQLQDCAGVLSSLWSRPLGLPLSAIGTGTFVLCFVLTLLSPPWAVLWLRGWCWLVGAVGAGLLAVQVWVIHRICPWCVTVDATAIVLVAMVGFGGRGKPWPTPTWAERRIWLGVGGMAGLVPVGLWVSNGLVEAPAQVKRFWQPNCVNIVAIVDFGCPHCRRLYHELLQIRSGTRDRVHIVLIAAAIPGNSHSREAALAYRAAERLGKGMAMANALFESEDRSAANCERLALSIGLPCAAYRARLLEPLLAEQLASDMQWMRVAAPQGLPAVWVQDHRLVGQAACADINAEIDRALQAIPNSSRARRHAECDRGGRHKSGAIKPLWASAQVAEARIRVDQMARNAARA